MDDVNDEEEGKWEGSINSLKKFFTKSLEKVHTHDDQKELTKKLEMKYDKL